MFSQQTNLLVPQTTKAYLRLKDKRSFLLSLKEPIVLRDLKELAIKKTKIPEHDLVVLYHGKPIDFSQQLNTISLKDRCILYVVNKKNLRNDIIEILVKFHLRNQQKACLGETKLFAKSEDSIREFIHSNILQVIEEICGQKTTVDMVNLVSNGNVLKKTLNFKNYLIEDGSEIICMVNCTEALQKLIKNVPTHRIIVSHKQKAAEQNQIEISKTSSPINLVPNRKKSQIQKKPSITLSENRSDEFVKLDTFESKQDMAEKQRLFNESLENEGSKLKKKEKITSDLVRKFEHQMSLEQQQTHEKPEVEENTKSQQDQIRQPLEEQIVQLESSPTQEIKQNTGQSKLRQPNSGPNMGDFILIANPSKNARLNRFNKLALNFSKFLNRNVLDDWFDEPDSPIEVEYPKVERRGPSMIEWDPTVVSENIEEKSERYIFSEVIPQKLENVQNNQPIVEAPASEPIKMNKIEDRTESSIIRKGDFLIAGSLTTSLNRMNENDYIKQLTQRFDEMLLERYGDSQSSTIQVEYPKLQKRAQPKAGDFIIFGQKSINSDRLITPDIVQKFNKVLNQINSRRAEQYGVSQDQTQVEGNQDSIDPNLTNPEKDENCKQAQENNVNTQTLQKLESQLEAQNEIKLGDFLAIKKIDFSIPKSKLLESILDQYSHLTTV